MQNIKKNFTRRKKNTIIKYGLTKVDAEFKTIRSVAKRGEKTVKKEANMLQTILESLPVETWLIIAAIVVVAIVIVAVVISEGRRKKAKKFEDKTGVEYGEKHRYSTDDAATNQNDQANATYLKGDIIVACGQTLTAGKKGELAPGKYTVLTAVEGVDSFNVRVGGFVRELQHDSVVVLGEGDTFCPVSHAVILR